MADIRNLGRATLTAAGLLLAATAPAWAGSTERVSISSTGEQADGNSTFLTISADGRFVAFGSDATNLVPGDTNGVPDGFVRDRLLDKTELVSVATDSTQANDDSGAVGMSAT